MKGTPHTHLLTSKGMMSAGFSGWMNEQNYNQRNIIKLSSLLPAVHRYRADVSLGRFARADWLRATSGLR